MQHFKNTLKILIALSARWTPSYTFFWHPLSRVCQIAERARLWNSLNPSVSHEEALGQISPDLSVRNGPFKGLKYPVVQSFCSALIPKLLGSYECELHPIFDRIIRQTYSDVLDIGCAEGYYAVALALAFPAARIWAFDTNPDALSMCRAMADLNGVGSRVVLNSSCSESRLRSITFSEKALILSDCEGYERRLFTESVCRHLEAHDVLIETHDFKDHTISNVLCKRFCSSHSIEIISSIPDSCRPQVYKFLELDRFDRDTRISLMAEGRPTQMDWIFFQSRHPQVGCKM